MLHDPSYDIQGKTNLWMHFEFKDQKWTYEKKVLKSLQVIFRGIYNSINSRETTKTKGGNKLYTDSVRQVGEQVDMCIYRYTD